MWTTPSLFKTLTNFTLQKFEKLVALVVPTIESHVQSTNDCSFILTQGTLGPIMMSPFCPNQICTKIGTNYSCTRMIILSTYWATQATWVRRCL
jgi:hypothetical protein